MTTLTPGDSVRHTCDMKREKTLPPRDPFDPTSAGMIYGFAMLAAFELRHLGASDEDLRKFPSEFGKVLELQYDRKVAAQALRERRRWRKSDLPRLIELLLRPGLASPKTQGLIAQLQSENASGHGVIPEPKRCDEAFFDSLSSLQRIANSATSRDERRELRKRLEIYPEMIEAAYRGELGRAQEANVVETPRLKASEIAEWKVADAAGISPAKVHQLCQEARDRVAIAEKWAAARPGVRSVQRKPEMTTKELKGWLEGCPS